MEFGMQFFPCVEPEEKSASQYFGECLELVGFADRYGYSHIRTVEHYFHPYGGYSPNPIVFLSAAAQISKKARIVTGAVLPVFNNPLKLAGEIAMLDGLSDGRLEVGIARAFVPEEFRHFKIELNESVARFDEGVEQLILLLENENVSHLGRFHDFENVTSLPRPVQKPRPQFWTAAFATPDSFEKAGRAGNWIMGIPIAGGQMAELLGIYREAWKSAGHKHEPRCMLAFHMLCHENREEAKDLARAPIKKYFDMLVDSASSWIGGETSDDYKGYGKLIEALKKEDLDSQMEKCSAWVGTPKDIVEIAHEYDRQCGGFDDASLQINFTTLPHAAAKKSVQLFGEKLVSQI
ncbi:MAG: LLM class flavin-dependent oxidoreductase [Alphaproteobacteria bacterium]